MTKVTNKAPESRKGKRKEKVNTKNNDNDENDAGSVPDNYDENEDLLNMEIPLPPPLIMNADGGGQRLIISHLEVENFKSYYGKQTIGPFHKVFFI